MDLLQHGRRKFPDARLMASSAGLGWEGLAVELRSHPAGDLAPIQPDQLEITLAVAGEPGAVVSRKGAGLRQQTRVEAGALWISPAGVCEDDIRITRPLSRILHMYLPARPFEALADTAGGRVVRAGDIRYLAGVRDELIRQIGCALLAEVTAPSAGGRVLAETLGLALTARLAHGYAQSGGDIRASAVAIDPADVAVSRRHPGLDDVRVRRVIDFMWAHLEDDIGLADLAAVACLSPFHFSRMFRQRVGVPPHRYLAQLRLESAKVMLSQGRQPVAQIAAACRFSSQANFARAFRQATGMTPGDYRRGSGQR